MNNNVVEKTLKSIDNIDRLSDLAAISIYNTSHEAIDKFDVEFSLLLFVETPNQIQGLAGFERSGTCFPKNSLD